MTSKIKHQLIMTTFQLILSGILIGAWLLQPLLFVILISFLATGIGLRVAEYDVAIKEYMNAINANK